MKESAERVQYITEYIVSYQAKIETLNKKGLFDTATLYEIFAQKICELWFGQKFSNLNVAKANFPYVDLISEDKKVYVQVSTVQDIPSKVQSTLEKIRDSKSKELQNVNKLFFVVLANDSVKRVRDFTGEYRIGNIDFIKDKNLITTDDIVQKAKTDIEFQISLYDFLQRENDSLIQTGNKLEEAVILSRALIKNNIDYFINDEYVIDRSKEIEQIQEDGMHFISIQGDAGSGKSALCKIMLENEELLLYARAEKISESRTLEEIWRLDLSEVVKYLEKRKLVIYIDALEFIADGAKTKLDLLQQIYEIVKGHDNIFVVTSCRSCDKNAFIKIESIYHIKIYDISLLTDKQIIQVAKKYKIIQELWDAKLYIQLLRSPFYINLIIKEIKDFKQIGDVDGFRNLIWTEVMCMHGKTLPYGILHSDIRKAIEKIVFNRARYFLPGVKKEEIGEELVYILQSENIVTLSSDDTIRLKYDIFEDICFERFIDGKYDECKNDYDVFFSSLEQMGRCVYRRYQIWVENKLFSKGNREKFLYKLLETDKIPIDWKVQTIVGIVKSNFCDDFFEEYTYSISGDLLKEFVRLTNDFSFETTIISLKYGNVYSKLKPIGLGRPCLINLIFNRALYKEKSIEKNILKLCSDYSQNFSYNDIAVDAACRILEFYIEEKIGSSLQEKYFHLADDINECLMPLYRMAEKSQGWIKQFWSKRIDSYLNSRGSSQRLSKKIMEYALKNAVSALGIYLAKELCEVANAYWVKTPEYDKRDFYYRGSLEDVTEDYGLSRNADDYRFEYRNVYQNAFLNVLVHYNWIVALEWIINLTNHVSDAIKVSSPESVYEISIWKDSPCENRSYICNLNFWLAGIQEHRVHELISDSIFLFTRMTIEQINSEFNDKKAIMKFAEYIKSEIVQKANNVMMLSVISEIGRNCEKVISGYSLFLASSIDLVMLDNQKIRILLPNAERQFYEEMIFMSVGLPEIEKRYDVEAKENDSLQDIVLKMQLLGGEKKEKAEQILDFLYSIISNRGEDARLYLQIQKMDLRNADVKSVDEHTYAIVPEITGEAKKIVEENSRSKFNQDRNAFQRIVEKCNSLMTEGKFKLQECLDMIVQLQTLIKDMDVPGQAQRTLVMIIAYALEKYELTLEKRSELCSIWLDGVNSIFNKGSFMCDINLIGILYKQIEYEIDALVKEKMKRHMLNCLLDMGQEGIIFNISVQLKKYLMQNANLAQLIFNTIVAISEDNMACFKYNVSKLNEIGERIDYCPNKNNAPIWVKHIFEKNRIPFYQSKKEEIINMLLIQEIKKDFSNWDIEECDIQTLCYISNCGLNFENEDFKMVMKKVFPYIVNIISTVEGYHKYLNAHAIGEVTEFINKSLIDKHNISDIIDMLFDLPDFTQIDSDGYRLYEEISKHLLTVYFDGYNNAAVRNQCEAILKEIEYKIAHINDIKVRENLYAMMFLTLGDYHMSDWNKFHTKYSYKDKIFLNRIWSKYGWLYFKNLLRVIDQMHIVELLPEVIIPLNRSLYKYKDSMSECERTIKENEIIINKIITKAFLDFADEIKFDKELTQAFEEFLGMLIEFDMEEAAVILDEFRVH